MALGVPILKHFRVCKLHMIKENALCYQTHTQHIHSCLYPKQPCQQKVMEVQHQSVSNLP